MKKQESGMKIDFIGLNNTRDLGGYQTRDGRCIVPGKLIRSGALSEATKADCQLLLDTYQLHTIVDFRTQVERQQKPDPVLADVDNIHVPILDEATIGITHEEEGADPITSLIEHVTEVNEDPENYVRKLYQDLLLNEHAISHYAQFFELLRLHEEGSILWHCSVGKDRVGIGTALLMYALDIPKETILQDFLKTQLYLTSSIERISASIMRRTDDRSILSSVEVLLGVKKSYLQDAYMMIVNQFGSVDQYLEQQLGLTTHNRELLKDKFLI